MSNSMNPKKTQSGFTLIELMIVVTVLAILASVGMKGYTTWVRGSNVDAASYFVERDFLSAATQCFRIKRTYTSCTKAELTKYGLDDNTPWDTAWTVTVSGNRFQLSIPVPDTTSGTMLAERLNSSDVDHINNATSSGTTVSVQLAMP